MSIANLTVRPFEPADLPELVLLEQSSVAPDRQRSPEHLKYSRREGVKVAVLDGRVVGYVDFSSPDRPCSCVILFRIVVQKELRRQGIGQALLDETIALAAPCVGAILSPCVPIDDLVAQQFLRKSWFRMTGGMQAYQWRNCTMLRGRDDEPRCDDEWRAVQKSSGHWDLVRVVNATATSAS